MSGRDQHDDGSGQAMWIIILFPIVLYVLTHIGPWLFGAP